MNARASFAETALPLSALGSQVIIMTDPQESEDTSGHAPRIEAMARPAEHPLLRALDDLQAKGKSLTARSKARWICEAQAMAIRNHILARGRG